MSDEGERTCPLCAEEMDLTDQQLKPCKCGYEICVWCWHHIMDMAEKDDTEGRCPACRSPYDKEKIVGMAANCERLVAEINIERKMKNQKAKSKSSEGRKQLSSVRVIQRNLVYIVGLPLNLADEDILQQREYFSQYGKVLKVSMSRTAAGVIQQFPNNTCSVYITYSKEEEAIRCIQNVHGFVLEGRPLRACFGTTKYCHAWLRNMPCSNPDCLYLHDIGSQEDSFTKDEIISAYTRSRVQQITGATNNMQRRSGNVLPPPMDDYINNSSGKVIVKNALSNSASILKGSPPNGSSGRSTIQPAAAWGTRATNCQPPAGGLLCPNGSAKLKPDTVSGTLAFSSAVASTSQNSSLHSGATKRPLSSDGSHNNPRVQNELLKPMKLYNSMDNLSNAGEKTATSDGCPALVNLNSQLSALSLSRDGERGSCTTANITNSPDITGQLCSSGPEEATIATNEEIQNLCSDLSSVNIDRNGQNEYYGIARPISPPSDRILTKSSPIQGSQQHSTDKFRDALITSAVGKAAPSDNEVCIPREQSDWRLDSQAQIVSATTEVEDDIVSFDNQRLKDPEVVCHSPYLPKSTSFLHVPNNSGHGLIQDGEPCPSVVADFVSADHKVGEDTLLNASNVLCSGYPEKLVSSRACGLNSTTERSFFLQDERNELCSGRLFSDAGSDAALDKGESSIISNILSMDFDPWDDSLTSPQNLAKLLSDNTDNQSGPLIKSSSLKVQNNSQSRFSFARQEEPKFQTFHSHSSYGINEQLPKRGSFIQGFAERDLYMDKKLGIANGFPSNKLEESENLGIGHFVASNKLSAVSRAQISAPPGFSVPSRPPPPGFSSYERVEQAFDSIPGNSLLDPSSLLRNSYQTPTVGNIGGTGDIEFMDPAILAVGRGRIQGAVNSPGLDMRSNFSPPLNYFDNEARLQLLMQRSLSPPQNLRFSEIGNNFSQLSDSYGISSRLDQSQVSNLAPYAPISLQHSRNSVLSNGQWDGWNEVQSGSGLGVAELLRNERVGFNKLYTGYDDSKYRMPNSGDLYNRTYGM